MSFSGRVFVACGVALGLLISPALLEARKPIPLSKGKRKSRAKKLTIRKVGKHKLVRKRTLSDRFVLKKLSANKSYSKLTKLHGPFQLFEAPTDEFASGVVVSPRGLGVKKGSKHIATLELSGVTLSVGSDLSNPNNPNELKVDSSGSVLARFWPGRIPHNASLSKIFMFRFRVRTSSSAPTPMIPAVSKVTIGSNELTLQGFSDGTFGALVDWPSAQLLMLRIKPGSYGMVFEWAKLTRVE